MIFEWLSIDTDPTPPARTMAHACAYGHHITAVFGYGSRVGTLRVSPRT
jgi:hypothetical protein